MVCVHLSGCLKYTWCIRFVCRHWCAVMFLPNLVFISMFLDVVSVSSCTQSSKLMLFVIAWWGMSLWEQCHGLSKVFRVRVAVRMGKVYAIVMFLLFSGSVAPVVCSVSKQDACLQVPCQLFQAFLWPGFLCHWPLLVVLIKGLL